MEFHQDSAKEKNLEFMHILAFVIRSSFVVLEDKMLKHARLELVLIRFFSIVTGPGFWDVLTLEEVWIFFKTTKSDLVLLRFLVY